MFWSLLAESARSRSAGLVRLHGLRGRTLRGGLSVSPPARARHYARRAAGLLRSRRRESLRRARSEDQRSEGDTGQRKRTSVRSLLPVRRSEPPKKRARVTLDGSSGWLGARRSLVRAAGDLGAVCLAERHGAGSASLGTAELASQPASAWRPRRCTGRAGAVAASGALCAAQRRGRAGWLVTALACHVRPGRRHRAFDVAAMCANDGQHHGGKRGTPPGRELRLLAPEPFNNYGGRGVSSPTASAGVPSRGRGRAGGRSPRALHGSRHNGRRAYGDRQQAIATSSPGRTFRIRVDHGHADDVKSSLANGHAARARHLPRPSSRAHGCNLHPRGRGV